MGSFRAEAHINLCRASRPRHRSFAGAGVVEAKALSKLSSATGDWCIAADLHNPELDDLIGFPVSSRSLRLSA